MYPINMIKNFFRSYWLRMVIGFIVAVILYIVYLIIKSGWHEIVTQCDALFFAGILCFLFGCLALVVNLGTFNLLSFLGGRRKLDNGLKEDYYTYSKRKQEERAHDRYAFIAYFVAATPFLIASLILLIIIN